MFISAAKERRRHLEHAGFVYLLLTLLCALCGAVYEQFSHEVYSNYMIYAFLIPLAGGAIPCYGVAHVPMRNVPGRLVMNLHHSGIAALTVGCFFQGVLEIYGTTNALTTVYWLAGAGFIGTAFLLYLMGRLLPHTH